ncbi:hypothetical protein Sjap_008755 [Stephania japonica]|uniref:UDP-N-acetylglucosamine transferase subunit ALG14 n=1 Tax=Stephania japonica TaxID=461633 RepID=A0AAP0PES2_9MAGN
MKITLAITLTVVAFTVIVTCIIYVMHKSNKPISKLGPQSVSTLIVLGSGGHTAEMLNLVAVLQKDKFTPRTYIAASTDNMSLQKASTLEASLVDEVLQCLKLE